MKSIIELANPKQSGSTKSESWYGYYAGYSGDFVQDVLTFLELPEGSTILDPWNGTGTTTAVAKIAGYKAIGIDANPVMNVVAKANLLSYSDRDNLLAQSKRILRHFETKGMDIECEPSDALLTWLMPKSVCLIRGLERAVLYRSHATNLKKLSSEWVIAISPSTAFFYVALFRVIRQLVSSFGCTNPTWIKEPSSPKNRGRLSVHSLLARFNCAVEEMIEQIPSQVSLCKNAQILTGSSTSLNLASESVDAVISSPPYCTRIDYAIATKPELALLGMKDEAFDGLRRKLIGSPTINGTPPSVDLAWGKTCGKFLDAVYHHGTKASNGYYFKNHAQYFSGIQISLAEINRVLKPGGYCCLVVQDSYYKDIYNDLPRIFIEMANLLGWEMHWRLDFENKRSIRLINGKTRKYGRNALPVETAMLFEKEIQK